jgi:prepilin-type N-terminal cleavage/methylation domain-containing protein
MKMKQNGFSLTEVLMAAGILSVGIMLVATMFPAAIYLTTVASEKTFAAIVADQAFAKMRLYGIKTVSDPNQTKIFRRYWEDMNDVIDFEEYTYPSFDGKWQYGWVPLCKKLNDDPCDLQYLVKLYVSRRTNPNQKFFSSGTLVGNSDMPIPISVKVVYTSPNKLLIDRFTNGPVIDFISPPPATAIVDDQSGRVFRITSKDAEDTTGRTVLIDRRWDKDINTPDNIWLLPAAVIDKKPAGRNPDVEIFQKIITFKNK